MLYAVVFEQSVVELMVTRQALHLMRASSCWSRTISELRRRLALADSLTRSLQLLPLLDLCLTSQLSKVQIWPGTNIKDKWLSNRVCCGRPVSTVTSLIACLMSMFASFMGLLSQKVSGVQNISTKSCLPSLQPLRSC